MHVHVDHVRRHVHAQKKNGMTADHQQPAIRFTEGMLELDEELERLLKEEEGDDDGPDRII